MVRPAFWTPVYSAINDKNLLTFDMLRVRWRHEVQRGCAMKRGSAVLLQAVVAFVGIGALAFLLGEPHLEGRNKHATLFEIYFKDVFLAFAYVASIPFFVALYKAFRVLGYAGKDQALSHATVSALRTIKLCALAVLAFVAASVVFMPF